MGTKKWYEFAVLLVFIVFLAGCAHPVPREKLQRYIDRSGKTKPELIAELKREFEGEWFGRSGYHKIERVTSKGFYWSKEERNDIGFGKTKRIVFERVRYFYPFTTPPLLESGGLGTYFIRCGNYDRLRRPLSLSTGNKYQALRLYGLLESIYNSVK